MRVYAPLNSLALSIIGHNVEHFDQRGRVPHYPPDAIHHQVHGEYAIPEFHKTVHAFTPAP